MRIVLDTNVLVSALLKPESAPARVVEYVLGGEVLTVLVDERILEEYREVLSRKKFGFEPTLLKDFLDASLYRLGVPARVLAGLYGHAR